MANANPQGEIRPQSVPSLEVLSNTLATVDAVGAMLEHALANPSSITPVWSRAISAQFRMLADAIDDDMEARHV